MRIDDGVGDHELEQLRRSLAMLPVGAQALSREEALLVLGRLREVTGRLRRLEAGLRELLQGGTGGGPAG